MSHIALATLNCAGKQQPAANIQRIVTAAVSPNTDIFAFAVQEAAPVLESLLDTSSQYLHPIYKGCEAGLLATSTRNFRLVAEKWTGGIGLLVYSHLTPKVELASVDFGMYWTCLKGAVACRLRLEGTTTTFVAAHLPAHAGEPHVEQRNQTYRILATGLQFEDGSIYDTNNLFVLGDLNYRAASSDSSSASASLLNTDELTRERLAGRTLMGLHEAPITFKPTFKYYLDSQEHNLKRAPSWTDRIFFSDPHAAVTSYSSLQDYESSDHRPVYLQVDIYPKATTSKHDLEEVYVLPGQLSAAASKTLGTGMFLATTKIGWFLVVMLLIGGYVALP